MLLGESVLENSLAFQATELATNSTGSSLSVKTLFGSSEVERDSGDEEDRTIDLAVAAIDR